MNDTARVITLQKQLEPLLYRYKGITDYANALYGATKEDKGSYAEAHLLLWELLNEATGKLGEIVGNVLFGAEE